MKIHVLWLIFLFLGCKENKVEVNEIHLADSSYEMETVTPNSLVMLYSDSANNYKAGDIPYFFYDYQLDYDHPWITSHFDWSVREQIFANTMNIDLLTQIVNSSDARLRKIVEPGSVKDPGLLRRLPLHDVSNYELAVRRLKELQKK